MPARLDLYRTHKAEYVAPRKPVLVVTKPAKYLAVQGRSVPGAPEFDAAIGALYAVAFTTKMARKFAGRDYAVSKLEGLWWNPEAGEGSASKKVWNWRLMIRTPDFITPAEITKTKTALLKKGKPATISKVKLVKLAEGRCVQMLHVGPYDQEQPTMDAMKAFAAEQGHSVKGRHHEIYLSDPRRVEPARLKTILRYPVR
jgi:hypothetical protein